MNMERELVIETFAASKAAKVKESAFQYCEKLHDISFEQVTYVDDSAFEGTNVQHVNLPKVEYLGSYVFKNCTGLISIDAPKLQQIGAELFTIAAVYEKYISQN